MDKSLKPLFVCSLSCFVFFTSCEEAAIPVDSNLTTTPLSIDTVSFPVINTISYQVPPDIGSHEFLYFGKKDEFSFLYNLCLLYTSDAADE